MNVNVNVTLYMPNVSMGKYVPTSSYKLKKVT